jgi:hypothetical protein
MPDKQRFYFFSRFYESESRWTGRGDTLSMIKKSKELIDNFDLGWKGNVKARVHSANLIINIAKNNDPVFRAQIETYKYYQNKVELLDETFRNSSLFYLEYKWKCKTIIKNDQHKEIRSYRYQMLCVY